jgi:hypothetical protein
MLDWNIASPDCEPMKNITITAPAFREILLSSMPLLDPLQCQESPRFKMSGM